MRWWRIRSTASGRRPWTLRTRTRKPARSQRLGVDVGERLVLGEVLEADHDARPVPRPARAVEAVDVDELAADRLRQPAVDHGLVEPAQQQRGERARGDVEAPPDRRPVARAVGLQRPLAHHRHHAVGEQHVAVVAQRDDVRARHLRIGGERDPHLGDAVVQRRDARAGDGERHEHRRRVESVRGLQPRDAARVDRAVPAGREAHLLRLRRRGAEPKQRATPTAAARM